MAARTGSGHHNAKLTDRTVRAARKAYNGGSKFIVVNGERRPVNVRNLAEKYGVSHQSMHSALTGRTWKHVES